MLVLLYQNTLFADIPAAVVLLQPPVAAVLRYSTLFYRLYRFYKIFPFYCIIRDTNRLSRPHTPSTNAHFIGRDQRLQIQTLRDTRLIYGAHRSSHRILAEHDISRIGKGLSLRSREQQRDIYGWPLQAADYK